MPARRVLTDDDMIAALYEDRYSHRVIAEALGLSLTTVWRRLVAASIPRRRPGARGHDA